MTDALSIVRDLIRCPSVTPADAGALGVLENLLKAAGFTAHRITFSEPGTADVDNLYARLGGSAPHVTFAGHTDVVPPGDQTAWSVGAFSGDVKDGLQELQEAKKLTPADPDIDKAIRIAQSVQK